MRTVDWMCGCHGKQKMGIIVIKINNSIKILEWISQSPRLNLSSLWSHKEGCGRFKISDGFGEHL